MATTTLYTADDLWRMPGDEPWELWDGELRKVPGAGALASGTAGWIGTLVSMFVRPRRLGVVTAANGEYIFSRDPDTVVVPDMGFIRWERLPGRQIPKGFCPVPPDLAVEVFCPMNHLSDIPRKLALYRRAEVPLVWWVYPKRLTVAVYRDGDLVGELGESDVLEGGDILPGLRLSIAEVFSVG